MFPLVIVACVGLLALVLVKLLNQTDIPKIQHLPEIPGVPIFGNLLQFGSSHARRAFELSKTHGPVFQVRFGTKRIVFANSFDSVHTLWQHNRSALISRPKLHTFHTVVSSTQGFTIGTSPWDESCKRRRKAAATALNRLSVVSYMPILDFESAASIRELLEDSNGGEREIDPIAYFQRFALNTSLTCNYGDRIDGRVDSELLREIYQVERAISNFRSTSNNWQDYIPLLRLLPVSKSGDTAHEYKDRRDKYLNYLLSRLKKQVSEGTGKPCITGNILKDPEAKLNEDEIKSICLTMIAGGLDTLPPTLSMGLAYLSSPNGQTIQARAYEAITSVYPKGDAWHKCVQEEKVPYVGAFVQEVLRFFSVIPICLPRVNIEPIEYKEAIIPAGTTFLMNAWAANYDEKHFKDPRSFIPERYLDLPSGTGPLHYAYGAGSRMCAGSHLANRELYVSFVRLISAFHVEEASAPQDRPILDALGCSRLETGLTSDPRPFKVKFKVRNRAALDEWLMESERNT